MTIDNTEKTIINALCTQNAVLFTGAGLSIGAKNLNHRHPMMAKELSKEISNLIGIDEDEDLEYTSDVLINNHKDKIPDFIRFLTSEYSITDVSEPHKIISSIAWRRVYTTNYDRVFEFASKQNKRLCNSIDIMMKPKDYLNSKNDLCIHINGIIDNLKEDDLHTHFKLSSSSYISAENFTNSDWYSLFKRDLEHCSVLLFAGYSLYDIDIEKVLFSQNDEFKNKTFFIVGENCQEKQLYKLKKYGTVIEKNINYLSDIISKSKEEINKDERYIFSALEKYELIDDEEKEEKYISDDEISGFLIYGNLNDIAIQKTITHPDSFKKYAVYREDLKKTQDIFDNNTDIIFGVSDFCNGKSVFCRQLAIFYTKLGYNVYTLTNHLEFIYDDLLYINKSNNKTLIIIDDYTKISEYLRDFFKVKNKQINIFLTARTSEHLKEINNLNIHSPYEINLDFLNKNEIDSLINICDGLGVWGERANLKYSEKISEIEEKHDRQIALVLTELLQSKVIKNKVDELLKDIFKVFSRKTIFYICVFKIIGIDMDRGLIDDLARNKEIYDSNRIRNSSFNTLFTIKNGEIDGKSSLFCAWIIKNFYSSKEIMNEMHAIANYFNTRRQDFHNNYSRERIFRSTLKFSFIERILPEKEKKENLKFYYDRLKDLVEWLKRDPHFWLQYAMAFMTFKDKYNDAQNFLDTAYALANSKPNYIFDSLDNQQARLYIKIAREQQNAKICFEFFKKAYNLLQGSSNDMYKFRQMQEYKVFYKEKYSSLNKNDKNEFISLIKNSISTLKKGSDNDRLKEQLIDELEKIINHSIN